MKNLFLSAALMISLSSFGQTKMFTKNGKVSFNASSPLEKIEAVNDKATSVVDATTGSLDFAVLMKAFIFERALMQEHFNENYVESDKYPKATFKGKIADLSAINLSKDGNYPVNVKGAMTLHGVTKDIETTGTMTVKGGSISAAKSKFKILLSDYNISIPSVVKDKISNNVEIDVDVNYQPFKSTN